MIKNYKKLHVFIIFIVSVFLLVACVNQRNMPLNNNNYTSIQVTENVNPSIQATTQVILPSPTTNILLNEVTSSPTPSPTVSPKLPKAVSWADNSNLYVFFGSYPQTEITTENLTEEIVNATYDDYGIAYIDGINYKRIKEEDATYSFYQDKKNNIASGYYNWSDVDYAYFKYEPIKWRILYCYDDKLLLVSEMTLDTQKYNMSNIDVSWEESTLFSWLNGYDVDMDNIDYSKTKNNFITTAFSLEEINCLYKNNSKSVNKSENEENIQYLITLLSKDETLKYNLRSDSNTNKIDENTNRVTNNTDFAITMGSCKYIRDESYINLSSWWLRDRNGSSDDGFEAVFTAPDGQTASLPMDFALGIRPVICIVLESTEDN